MSSISRPILALIFLSLVIIGKLAAQSSSPTLKNRHIVDSLKRFPHHVTIETEANRNYYGKKLCGGSILSSHWIVTSGLCIEGSDRLYLHFQKLYYHSHHSLDDESFSIAVNKDEIYMHPTLTDDIALIHLPIELIFSDNLTSIPISSNPVDRLEGRMAVMPGFDVPRPPSTTITTTTTTTTTSGPVGTVPSIKSSTTSPNLPSKPIAVEKIYPPYPAPFPFPSLSPSPSPSPSAVPAPNANFSTQQRLLYGMFRILSNNECRNIKSYYQEFDEFLQMCSEDWMKSTSESISCWNHGDGLIVGWPLKSELVGIYSALLNNNCSNSRPVVYTNIAPYLPWIDSVIYDVAP